MRRPLRRFCYSLAEKLGVSVQTVFNMSSAEVSEWSAFYLTQNDKWLAGYHKEIEFERQAALTPEELTAEFKKVFGVSRKK